MEFGIFLFKTIRGSLRGTKQSHDAYHDVHVSAVASFLAMTIVRKKKTFVKVLNFDKGRV